MGARRRAAAVAVTSALVAGSFSGALTSAPASAVSTDQSYWVPVSKKIVVNGHGYGHGHGMSQHGAQGAALNGLAYKDIAGFYYPGTDSGTRLHTDVPVTRALQRKPRPDVRSSHAPCALVWRPHLRSLLRLLWAADSAPVGGRRRMISSRPPSRTPRAARR